MKILLDRLHVNPDPQHQEAAMFGYERAVETLPQRVAVNPHSLDQYGRSPLDYAQLNRRTRVIKLLSEPRHFTHRTSQTSDLRPNASGPIPSAQEEVEPSPVSQQRAIILDIRHKITGPAPLSLPDQPPLDQPEAHPQHPGPSPTLRSHASPDSAIPKVSRPLKRCITAIPQCLRRIRRKFFPPS